MNKRIKKKRKLEVAVATLTAEIAVQAEILKNYNNRASRLESMVAHVDAKLSGIALDNQAAIKAIDDEVDYIKKNYKKKWRK
ncbi:hypothetical protein [Streptococcus halichoeri]|uniref:hypothetical protein n=1 Tax=Streptococcus halichoeri TaxID=254785 RepID=UPI00135A5B4D|nr:hypothetical protein [Streptococcus halichoeri]